MQDVMVAVVAKKDNTAAWNFVFDVRRKNIPCEAFFGNIKKICEKH